MSINPKWELPLEKMLSEKEEKVENTLSLLGFNEHEKLRMITNLKNTNGGDKLSTYIIEGIFNNSTNYKGLISKVEGSKGSVIPAVLQALEKAEELINSSTLTAKNLYFEKDTQHGDIDLQATINEQTVNIYQFKTLGIDIASKLGREINKAANQIINIPNVTEKWVSLKLVNLSREDFDTAVSSYSKGKLMQETVNEFAKTKGIKVELTFMKGGDSLSLG